MPANLLLATFLSFGAGLLSFLSPCVLPLLPSYVSYITGLSFEELTSSSLVDQPRLRRLTLLNSLMFVLGFSLVFVAMGASATFAGRLLGDHLDVVRKVGGIFIIALGLYLVGLLKLSFLSRERHFSLGNKRAGYVGSMLVGVSFAAGWTPCIGPVLSSILVYASTYETLGAGVFLLSIYSLGLGLPFLLTALAINAFMIYFRRINRYIRFVNVTSGLLLIFMGILLYSDYFSILSGYLSQWIGFQGL